MTLTKHFSLSTKHFKAKHGFTLIELLIVISIIAILVASATTSWRNAQMKGRDGKRKADLKSVQQVLENYYQTNGKYPSSSSGQIQCNITGDSTVKTWGTSAFTCGPLTYMQQIPKDVAYQDAIRGYYYSSSSPNLTYVLSAELENDNDPDRVTTGVPCTPQSYPTRDFCVASP